MRCLSKSFKLILGGILFLSLLAGCGGGGGSSSSSTGSTGATYTPEKTLSDFSSAVKVGDISKAIEKVNLDSKDRLQSALENLDLASKEALANAILNATKIYESENEIGYEITVTLPDGQTVKDTFRLILVNGAWELTGL